MRELRFAREKRRINPELMGKVLVWILQIAIVCTMAFVCVWYFGRRVSNVGDSMSPILDNGEITMVNQIIYDASSPNRGDIIVFKPNGNENSHYYIKRIVGLPGETLQIQDGQIYIDGEVLEEEYETTPLTDAGVAVEEVTLGGDEYFVLGDNRESSEDSRMADIGNVKKEEIYGKAWFVMTPGKHFGFLN